MSSDDYPTWARRANIEGRVRVELQIDRQGMVADCKVVGSSGNAMFDLSTCITFKAKALFTPATTAEIRTLVTVMNWRLSGAEPFNPFDTLGLFPMRMSATWKLGAPMTAEIAMMKCSTAPATKICEFPPPPEMYRPDLPAKAKLTATLLDDNRLAGITLEAAQNQKGEVLDRITSRWGVPCYRDPQADITGWIAGHGYIVTRPGVISIGTRDFDSITTSVAAACPPLVG
ncbi:energy transducer TonB [Sphingomonas sp. ZT3P38]|uniref:energy transducer TonB n=1 Tax=Parasphingomonas zepuensis TaxID=3096161 RepID=UPI002FC90415